MGEERIFLTWELLSLLVSWCDPEFLWAWGCQSGKGSPRAGGRVGSGFSTFVNSLAIPLPSSKWKMWHFSSCWGFCLLCKRVLLCLFLKQSCKTLGWVFVLPYGSEITFTLHLYVLYSTPDKHTVKTELIYQYLQYT